MIRRIIEIDRERCNGCGACVTACHEGAIGLEDGKARLLRDDYCDGLGDCLPECPTQAIRFVEREALAYDEAAVEAKKRVQVVGGQCPGQRVRQFVRMPQERAAAGEKAVSQLRQWPCQIKLVAPNAAFLAGARLLIAADCTAFARASVHEEFMQGRVTLIGCPKLDMVDYSEKLGEIVARNEIAEVTVLRMEVPCCGGLEQAVKRAIANSGKQVACQVVTLATDGRILG